MDRQNSPGARPASTSCPTHHVVGVGASAGGLEALEKLFGAMPLDTGMSFVVIQHLSPDFESHMAELLGRVTALPVHLATDGVQVEPNSVYLIPPKMEMVISNGRLLLTERSEETALSHPIDQFLRALAQDCGRYSVGIILSGTGSDGSRGVADVNEAGGLVIAQEPATCKFDSMPVNAQQTGHVHLSMRPEAMGPALAKYVLEGTSPNQLREREKELLEETGVRRVFQLLQAAHGIDFSHYKAATVERRIQRRMDLARLATLQQYIEWLSRDPGELNELYRDLLIGVTEFFRDSEAFGKLETQIIPELLSQAKGRELRIWVCGCATGEEAYSVAMLFQEAIERSGQPIDLKLFATDAHRESLQVATAGLYDAAKLDRVSEERKERFFVKRRDGYLIDGDLRRQIVFAPHNVMSDPPFTQMDLVTCRNMLIYLQPPAQKKALSLFHFALRSSGVLFLGPSETPGDLSDEFKTIDSHWKIFEKRRDVRLPIEMRMPILSGDGRRSVPRPSLTAVPSTEEDESMPAVFETLLADVMPPSVVVNDRYTILHTFGGAESYLRFPAGRPSSNLLEVVDPAIKTSLAGALQHAMRDHKPVRYSGLTLPGDGAAQLQVVVEPKFVPASQTSVMLVRFERTGAPETEQENETIQEVDTEGVQESRIETLEHELSQSRQNLQATIEELQTSNEELQATNEEMIASNEELQSTNQELHSVNEELYSVNAEHQRRLTELKQANDDMHNLLASTRVGVIFLDEELYIRRFTPEIGRVFHLVPQDLGRSIEMILPSLEQSGFLDQIHSVLENHQEHESEVRDKQGNNYLVRMLPYRTDQEVVGVVIAFIDIQRLTEAQADVARFKFMCDSAADAQMLIDADGRFVYCNRMMCERLGYSAQELSEMTLMDVDTSLDRAAFVLQFEQAVAEWVEPFESEHRRKDGSTYPTETSLTSVSLHGKTFLFATVRDITKRRAATRELRLLEKAVASVASGIVITDPHQHDHPVTFANEGFYRMTGYSSEEVIGHNCRFLQCDETDPAAVEKIRTAIRRGEPCNVLLRNRRKDGTRFWNDLQITPVTDEHQQVIHYVGVLNDVTDRETASRQAQQNEDRLRWIMDSTAEGIYGLDPTGRCTFCNESAARMLGYEAHELVGQSLHELIHHTRADGQPYPPQDCPIRMTAVNGRKINRNDEVFWRKDGSSFPVEYWSYPKQRETGFAGAVITFVDITKRKRDEETLRRAQEQANAANEAKSEFLANMSHELRTPMAAVLGFAEILQHECDDEQILEKVSAIQRNGDYLLQLLDDVLDLSKIEAGAVKLNQSTCDVEEILRDLHDLMHIRAEELERGLVFHCPQPLPETVTTDPARLRQVLVNLIGNGLKFSPGGRVDVTTTLVGSADQPQIRFQVADTGIGMSRSQLNRLFKPFTQADAKIAQQFGGTGLGLSISKRLVESLGGTLSVESEVGRGSTFTVTLPAAPLGPIKSIEPPPERNGGADPSAAVEARRRLTRLAPGELGPLDARVLIADDMRDIRYIGRHFLRKAGCRVSVVENGQQAVEAIQHAQDSGHPFDLAVLDMQMPVMDGIEATRQLRERGVTIPILALTADAMKGTRDRVLEAGFTEYLSKPIDSQVLLATVQRLLNGQPEH